MQLIANWKDSWKFASNIVVGLTTVYDALYANVSAIQAIMTPGQFAAFNAGMGIAAVVLRVVRQSIPVSPEVKDAMLDHVQALPEKTT